MSSNIKHMKHDAIDGVDTVSASIWNDYHTIMGNVNFGGYDILNITDAQVQDLTLVDTNLDSKFTITYNSTTDSMDFTYVG